MENKLSQGKATPPSIKRWNERLALDFIKQNGGASKAELARELKLSSPTASSIADSLLAKGLLRCSGHRRPGAAGGRRAVVLEYHGQAAYIAAFDVGGTKIAACLSDLNGKILAKKQESTLVDPDNPETLLGQMMHMYEQLTEVLTKQQQEKIQVISVGIPGITDIARGVVVNSPNLGWYNVPVRDLLIQRTGKLVWVDNDVNMGALGELYFGAGKGYSDLVFVAVGTGIGSGIIIDGELRRGAHFSSGEVGYMSLNPGALDEDHKKHGFLEFHAAGPGFLRKFSNGRGGAALEGTQRELLATDVMAAAWAGDERASAIVRENLNYLGMAISNLAAVVDPELIIIGGGLAAAGQPFLRHIQGVLDWILPIVPPVCLWKLGSLAPLMGCVSSGAAQFEALVIDEGAV